MKKLLLLVCIAWTGQCVSVVSAQSSSKSIYKKGWIDFNKNGVKDIFEDPSQPVEKRVKDLLSQMTIEEKSCQLATLYGFGRVLKDSLPTPAWKEAIWKDGIANIDEQLNGVGRGAKRVPHLIVPFSNHVKAINETQRWFIEETRLGIPVDFSNYSMKACEFAFNLAKTENAEVILLHVYFTPIYASSLPYGDVFNYQIGDEESVKTIIQKVHSDLNALSEKIKEKVASGEFPNVKYSCILREGIPEEEILRYAKEQRPMVIIMGTRGKNQKDIDLIGSVTAEVIDRSRTAVLAIPENTPFKQFSEAKRIAFITNFDQRDLIAFEAFFNTWKSFHFSVSLIHLTDSKDTWNEIKLAGIKEYFHKQYPGLEIHYDVVMNDNLLKGLDQYIKDNHIDIITLTSYKRNIFARLFNPSIARKMIFHSDTPLLVINS